MYVIFGNHFNKDLTEVAGVQLHISTPSLWQFILELFHTNLEPKENTMRIPCIHAYLERKTGMQFWHCTVVHLGNFAAE